MEFFDSFLFCFFPFLFLNSTKVRCRCGRAGTVILAVALLLAESHLPLLMELLLPPSLARQCRRQFRRGGGTDIDVTSDEIPRERRARRALFRRFAVGALPGRHRASRQFLRTRFAATPGMT